MAIDFKTVLRDSALKATPKRIQLLELFEREHAPLSVSEIIKKIGSRFDTVTVYRALDALADAGIILRVDFQEREARYELAVGRKHHHHIVCDGCGMTEDIVDCSTKKIERSALKSAKRFAVIRSHALEFFGLCRKCNTIT